MNDGVLSYDGKGTPLWTEKAYSDFELVCDFTGAAAVFLRGNAEQEFKLNPAKKGWNRAIIRLKGDKLSVAVNGKVVTDNQPVTIDAIGNIAMGAGGAVQFRNVFVRDLKGDE